MKNQYKIGEFAQNLGVSAGFLKHHEEDGLLEPVVSENGYRYYKYSQAMLALQCMRLQRIGFSGKEAADILQHSTQRPIAELFKEKIARIRREILFDEEMIRCLEEIAAMPEDLSVPCSAGAPGPSAGAEACAVETWSIGMPPPFYYLENSRNGAFLNDPETFAPAREWNRYVPMVTTATRIVLDREVLTDNADLLPDGNNDALIREWTMGLGARKDIADRLEMPADPPVRLICPGKSLIWRSVGNFPQKSRKDHLMQTIGQPLRFCMDHRLKLKGEIYSVDLFASTAGDINYRNRVIMMELE